MTACSIIIPTLNESGNVGPLLFQVEEVTRRAKIDAEVIFVDDGSKDDTRETIGAYAGPLKVTLICRDHERGLASAVVAGAKVAANDLVVVMDADLSHSPEMIPALLKPLKDKSADMTLGSRFVEGAEIPGLVFLRTLGSRLATAAARLFTSASDPLTGFFAVNRRALAATDVTGSGFKIALEVLAVNPDFTVKEIPIIFHDRNSGSSKMSRAVVSAYMAQLLRLAGNRAAENGLLYVALAGVMGGAIATILFFLLNMAGVGMLNSMLVSMMLAANAMWIALLPISRQQMTTSAVKGYIRFSAAMLLGYFLQIGVLYPLCGDDPNNLLALVTLFLIAVIILFTTLGVSIYQDYFSWQKHPLRLGTLITGYFILLRLVFLGGPELLREEAYYWNYSQHMDTGYLDHPPMVSVLIWLGTTLFGHNEFGVRIFTYLSWLITAFFSWRFTRLMFDRKAAVFAVLLLSTLPIFFSTGLISTPDAPLVACWSGALFFLYRALVQERAGSWYPAGILLGIGLASKYTIAFLGPAIVVFMLLDSRSRKWFIRPQPYLAAILAVLCFSPVIWWNYQHEWASFLFQSRDRIAASTEFSTHELFFSILALLTPTGFAAVIAVFVKRREIENGICSRESENHSTLLFCLCMALVPLSIFTFFSLTKEIKLNWTGPLWLAILPLIGHQMTQLRADKNGLFMQRAWLRTFVILGLIYGASFSYLTTGQPFGLQQKLHYPMNWDKVAVEVEQKVNAMSEKEGQRPLVVGTDLYRTTSQLAFYRYKNLPEKSRQMAVAETVGRHLFGRSALMYNYWYDPAKADSSNILVVSTDKTELDGKIYQKHCYEMDSISEEVVKDKGENIGQFYYRELRRYITPSQLQKEEQQRAAAMSENSIAEN